MPVHYFRHPARWTCCLALLSAAAVASGQGAPAGPLYPQPGVEQEPTASQTSAIRVEANEVIAPVIVTNRSGEMLLTLAQKDFHIFEDGVEQPIAHFGVGGEQLSIALLVENSSRIQPYVPAIRKAGSVFAQPVLGLSAEATILEYDQSVRTLAKFTTDADALQHTIASIEPGDAGASLYDGMQRSLSALEERPQGQRRILLVIGESQDTGSESKFGDVLRHAQIANVTIYSVGLSSTAAALRAPPKDYGAQLPPLPTGDPRLDEANREMQTGADLMALAVWLIETGKNAIGPNALAVASKSTGGLNIHTVKDRSIERAIDAIGGELHAQYTVGYTPRANADSGYHEIKVTVDRTDVTVRTRPGYYLAEP
jgi:VWFA-related protein